MRSMRYVRYLNFIVAAGLPTAYAVRKNLNSEYKKDELQLKVDGKPVPMPGGLQILVDEVLKDMNLTEKEKGKIRPFVTKDRDMAHVALSIVDWDAYIGIPQYFLLDTDGRNDFLELVVQVEGKEFPKNQPEYKTLGEALTLSKEAKKFAIAQEIFLLQPTDVFHYILLPLLLAIKSNIISFSIEKAFLLRYRKKHPAWYHYFVFLNIYLLYGVCLMIFNSLKEKESAVKAAQLGPSYLKGGLEYYQKMLKRNKIIKKFNKKAPFGNDGDIPHSIISYSLPFAERLVCLKELKLEKQTK